MDFPGVGGKIRAVFSIVLKAGLDERVPVVLFAAVSSIRREIHGSIGASNFDRVNFVSFKSVGMSAHVLVETTFPGKDTTPFECDDNRGSRRFTYRIVWS